MSAAFWLSLKETLAAIMIQPPCSNLTWKFVAVTKIHEATLVSDLVAVTLEDAMARSPVKKCEAFLLSEILRHKVAPLQFDIYPLELTKMRKNRILCLIISFLALNYIPLCISLVFKQIKEFICSTFQETTAATPLVNRFS